MSTAKTPIALFTYNRPEHTDRTLEALSRCDRLDECALHVFCDGPKYAEHKQAVAATREAVDRWAAPLSGRVVQRSENLGLARSIVAGVSNLCDEYGRVIVLEDDLIVSPDFVDYMLQALDRYEDASDVYQISGYMFPVEHPSTPDAFFLPLTSTWGWATWARAWRTFDWEATGARQRLVNREIRKQFDLGGVYPYSDMLEDRLFAQNDSWGILWHYAVFKAEGLVLHPRVSLVWNAGMDGSGVHCGGTASSPQAAPQEIESRRLPHELTFPAGIQIDTDALERVKTCLAAQAPQLRPSALSRVRARLDEWLRKLRR